MSLAIRRLWFVAPAVLAGLVSAQTTWYVDASAVPPGDGSALHPYTSLQYAIDRATTVDGDTLLVAPGVYSGNVSTNFKDLSIVSTSGPLETRIQGQVILSDSSLEGFWIGGTNANLDTLSASASRCIVDGSVSNFDRGVFLDDASTLDHVTVFGFQTGVLEFLFSGGFSRIENSILFGNGLDLHLFAACGSGDVVQYCAIGTYQGFGASCGVGNLLGVDPLYWDVALPDVHLRTSSPCIDAGDPAAPLDLDGSLTDIGALPYDPAYPLPPAVYCTAKVNSLGCTPAIGWTGTASASGAPFAITCANELNHRPGLLFYGFQPKALAYQGGWLCVQAPVKRTPLADSGGTPTGDDCSGAYAFDFAARIQSGIDPALVAGATVYCQFWTRDGADPTGFGTNRSDALRFGIRP